MKDFNKLFSRTAMVLSAIALAVPVVAAAQIIVTPGNSQGWLIGSEESGMPPIDYVVGPGTPPLGIGSFFTQITTSNQKIILARGDYFEAPLADLRALSYDTYLDPTATNTNNWYVNLYVSEDCSGGNRIRLDYIPADDTPGVWTHHDAFAGTWNVNTGGTTTISSLVAKFPKACLNAFDIPGAGALRWNMGDTASNYVGYAGNIDNIHVWFNEIAPVGRAVASLNSDVTWDFEPASVPDMPAPALGGCLLLIGLAGAAALGMSRTPR